MFVDFLCRFFFLLSIVQYCTLLLSAKEMEKGRHHKEKKVVAAKSSISCVSRLLLLPSPILVEQQTFDVWEKEDMTLV